jgi:pyruvate carboxylase
MYPKVFDEYAAHAKTYGDTSVLPTPSFFFGMQPGEEFSADIEPGKTLFIKFLTTGSPHPDGTRTVFFELNGQPRDVTIEDQSVEAVVSKNVKADIANPTHLAAAMPGMVVGVAIHAGSKVSRGQKLITIEAMKMQTNITADKDGKIGQLLVQAGSQVEAGDLLLTIE